MQSQEMKPQNLVPQPSELNDQGPKLRMVQFNKIKQTLGDLYCKESGTKQWTKYYGIIKDGCLWLCEALISQSFKI